MLTGQCDESIKELIGPKIHVKVEVEKVCQVDIPPILEKKMIYSIVLVTM